VLIALILIIILISNIGSSFSISSINTTNATSGTNNTSKVKVVTSFFPIYEFVKKVGGDKIDVSVLIPAGAEPHDFDPTIQQIQDVESAALLVYNGAGMETTWITKVNPKFAP
ncbi:MAG: zinc ABC transporter substrate-binding protein, partial [Nitrososphaeraceae archaeon]